MLLEQDAITEDQLARAIGERYGLDHLDLTVFPIDMAAANLVDSSAAKRYEAVPVGFTDDKRGLIVAMADPANVLAVDDIAMLTRLDVKPAVASREDVATLVARLDRFGDSVREAVDEDFEDGDGEVVELRETADDAPIVKLVNSIIAQAAERGASDIHFEPDGRELRVRFRIDGVLNVSTSIPQRMVAGVDQPREDHGRARHRREARCRRTAASASTVDGRQRRRPRRDAAERARRVDRHAHPRQEQRRRSTSTSSACTSGGARSASSEAFAQSYGAVLATGPTGSGKSTTLYAALQQLNTTEKNIITIEDPVEYQLDGITQVQVNPRAGLTFANGLRSMMRADPDIIMVGEIRDGETAQIAIESALTGHLVLSTLHTNDAPTAITRLIEMGIEPFLVASAIDCVVAQRLARTLCSTCKKRTIVPASVLRASGFNVHARPGGVRAGRLRALRRHGLQGPPRALRGDDRDRGDPQAGARARARRRDRGVACREGMRRLRDDGFEKVKAGLTSLAEVARVTGTA